MRYGFTGSQTLDAEGIVVIDGVLSLLSDGTEFTTGACIRVDAYIGLTLVKLFPHAKHRVIVPADRKKVDYWWRDLDVEVEVEVVDMPAGTSYRDRNNRILDFTDKLLAFPAHPEDDGKSVRSGTWMTVRLARKRNIEIVPPFVFAQLCTLSTSSGNVPSMNHAAMERISP